MSSKRLRRRRKLNEAQRVISDADMRGRDVYFAHLSACSRSDAELESAVAYAANMGVSIRNAPAWVRREVERISRQRAYYARRR